MKEKQVDEAGIRKVEVDKLNEELVNIEEEEAKVYAILKEKMMVIPNIIDLMHHHL